jgi:hypothetical protein
VFTRSHGIWTQQGNKLIGTTSEYGGGLWSQGASVAMSADGNTAIVGGPSDNRTTGAAWVFTRSGGIWMQQGNKLVGAGTARAGEPPLPPGQGMAVALSGDGNTAVVGGWGAEATWVFARNGNVWAQQGKKLVGTGLWDAPVRACPWRCPWTVIPPLWADGLTQNWCGLGVYPQRRCLDAGRP